MNVNISNELNFSDVYRSVNYTGLLAKFTGVHSLCRQPNVVYTSLQKNEIHSLNIHLFLMYKKNSVKCYTPERQTRYSFATNQ